MKISIVDDTEKHQREMSEKHKTDKADTPRSQKTMANNDNNKMRESQKQRDSNKSHQKPDPVRGDSHKNRSAESESRKPDITRNGHEPDTIHIHLGRAESNHNADSRSSQKQDSNRNRDSTSSQNESSDKLAPIPQIQNLQNQSEVKRTGSFQKRSESQRRRSMDQLGIENDSSEVRYPTGTPSGTLSDLKKQRAEQHKFGSTDGLVANLFLQSLSSDSKKYSTGNTNTNAPSHPVTKDRAQNGRASSKSNLNNNAPSSQQRPHTFISDNGPLQKFSALPASPVIGEEDKFKNDCCVIL